MMANDKKKRSLIEVFAYFCLLSSFLFVLNKTYNGQASVVEKNNAKKIVHHRRLVNRESDEPDFVNEEQYIEYLSKKLTPQYLNTYPTTSKSGEENRTALQHHQFLHLHHMKTGGTSMDGLLQCAISRLRKTEKEEEIAYMNLHECGIGRYINCRDGVNSQCRERINGSAILSYCAPLMDLKTFGWMKNSSTEEGKQEEEEALDDFSLPNSNPHAVTVLRHPVNRIWSMFRFRTKSCYSCKPLTEVYKLIDANETEKFTKSNICITQLLNHQTRNLVSSQHGFDTLPDHEVIEDALHNMKNYFTMIGLTEEMNDTAKMVGKIFPWMGETIPGSNITCAMPHRNSSPRNNRCGKKDTHWDLPPHPDNETLAAIIAHNPLDMILYEQAVQQFHYQKVALDLDQAVTE